MTALTLRRQKRARALRYGREIRSSERFAIAAENLPTHVVLQRWSVSVGSGLPGTPWDESRKSRLPPLDDRTSMVVDQMVCHAPRQTRLMALDWYCGLGSASLIAERWEISRSAVYLRMYSCLEYFRPRFEASAHPDLLNALRLVQKHVEKLDGVL